MLRLRRLMLHVGTSAEDQGVFKASAPLTAGIIKEDSMSDGPVVLGVNRTQDASICLMHGSQVVYAIQKERLTRRKHHWGRLDDFRNAYTPHLPELGKPIDVLVECYSSDSEIKNLSAYEQEMAEILKFSPDCPRKRISHHLAHVYSVF